MTPTKATTDGGGKSVRCSHDYTKATRIGRAHYVCPKCGEDISLLLLLLHDAAHQSAAREVREAKKAISK